MEKMKKQKKTLRRCRSCLHIGSSKAAELFRQSSSQASNITTRTIRQKETKQKEKRVPHMVHKKMFQPAVPATGFPQGSSKASPGSSMVPVKGSSKVSQHGSSMVPARFQRKGPASDFSMFFGVCIFLSPLPCPRDWNRTDSLLGMLGANGFTSKQTCQTNMSYETVFLHAINNDNAWNYVSKCFKWSTKCMLEQCLNMFEYESTRVNPSEQNWTNHALSCKD